MTALLGTSTTPWSYSNLIKARNGGAATLTQEELEAARLGIKNPGAKGNPGRDGEGGGERGGAESSRFFDLFNSMIYDLEQSVDLR